MSPEPSEKSGADYVLSKSSPDNYLWLGYFPRQGGWAPRIWLLDSAEHYVSWSANRVEDLSGHGNHGQIF